MNARRKKVEKLIYDVFNTLDKSGTNTSKYKSVLGKLSDKEFDDFMIKFLNSEDDHFYLETIPFEREPKLQDIKKAADIIGIPLEEYVYMPYINGDKDDPIRTPYPVPVGYLHLKRLQQMLSKKNTSSISIDERNAKTGQAVGDSKNSRISDADTFALTTVQSDYALKEFLGFRADDMYMKNQALKQINQDGYLSLENLDSNPQNKVALNTLDVFYIGASLKTDLVTPGLFLKDTLNDKSVKQTTSSKYSV